MRTGEGGDDGKQAPQRSAQQQQADDEKNVIRTDEDVVHSFVKELSHNRAGALRGRERHRDRCVVALQNFLPGQIVSRYTLTNVLCRGSYGKSCDVSTIRSLATGIAAAAGSPWGNVFPAAGGAPAGNGTFDGKMASADMDGVRYALEPIERGNAASVAAGHLGKQEDYRLLLRRHDQKKPLGVLTLRPRLAPGVKEVVQTCQRHRVEIRLLSRGDAIASQALARRAEIQIIDGSDAVTIIRARQQEGAPVAFVADSSGGLRGL